MRNEDGIRVIKRELNELTENEKALVNPVKTVKAALASIGGLTDSKSG